MKKKGTNTITARSSSLMIVAAAATTRSDPTSINKDYSKDEVELGKRI